MKIFSAIALAAFLTACIGTSSRANATDTTQIYGHAASSGKKSKSKKKKKKKSSSSDGISKKYLGF